MQTAITQSILVETACPICGSAEYKVTRPPRYPENLSLDEFKSIYRASSDTGLLDQLVQCDSCDLIYVNPRPDDKLLMEGYSSTVDEKFVAQNPERIRTFSRLLTSVSRRLGLPHGGEKKRILDVGCAGGAFLVAANAFGFEAEGIEPSHWMAESGHRNYGVNIRQGILARGVYPASSFDVVSLWDVIEHLTQPSEVLNTIHQILRPGGYLLVNIPDYGSLAARLLGERWPFLLSVHLLYYTRATIRKQLETCGFSVEHMQPHWQALRLGYIFERMEPYVGMARHLRKLAGLAGVANLPVTYNVGQTLVVARRIS